MKSKNFFSKEERASIVNSIAEAEKETSGEIRVHLADSCKGEILDCAAHIFRKLKMHKTHLRNGVLFYFSIADRKFAIIGDVGINRKVPPGFWDQVKDLMASHFSKNEFLAGLTEGISLTGDHLKQYFPIAPDDKNELSNEISFGS